MSAVIIPITRYGATPEEWDHFTLILGLTADLLPVVSNPKATISPNSKMQAIGKTPSRYNQARHVAGIADWTSHVTTDAEIARWSREPDYGICIQTRNVRALDVDIEEASAAAAVHAAIYEHLRVMLPMRSRGPAKFLLAFRLAGAFTKRILRTAHGNVEFLADGQQFIAAGTHPSGERYQWVGGLPDDIPTLTAEKFERLWQSLEQRFAVEPSVERGTSSKSTKLTEAAANDETAKALHARNLVLGSERDGRLHIECPFKDQHTTESAISATSYFPANTGGYSRGHFVCLHAHCEKRTDEEFKEALGLSTISDEFALVTDAAVEVNAAAAPRFQIVQAADFATRTPPSWLIKQVLPAAELVVVYGESTSGKSFFALDMLIAIARGLPWRQHITTRGRCVYIVAEGAAGFQMRLRAWAHVNAVPLADLDLYVLGDAPNLLLVPDVKALIASINQHGPVSVVVVDTLAQTMVGGEENSAQDMGKVVAHCKAIHKHTGATVVLIHHSGKDATKGARGSSALKAASDAEIEIVRADEARVATVTKLKDGSDGAEFGFRLQTVLVGEDDDGEDITSCVVEHVAVAPRAARRKLVKEADQIAILSTYDDMLTLSAENGRVEHIPLVEKAAQGMAPRNEKEAQKGCLNRARKALDKLVAGNVMAVEGAWCWRT